MSAGRIASRGSDQFPVRFPEGMRDRIKAEAEANGRSMNSEIVARLEAPSMTLRDHFAAQAMQAIISKMPLTSDLEGGPVTSQAVLSIDEFSRVANGIALGAYDYADAMLKAREAKP